jgi:hypothetical protein
MGIPGYPQNHPNKKNTILVGGIPTPLKNSSELGVGMIFPNIWKNKKCSKPPTSTVYFTLETCGF